MNKEPVALNALLSPSPSLNITNLALNISKTGPKTTAPKIATIDIDKSHTSRPSEVPKYADEIITVNKDRKALKNWIKDKPNVTRRVLPDNLSNSLAI